jgi:hypothetical protein
MHRTMEQKYISADGKEVAMQGGLVCGVRPENRATRHLVWLSPVAIHLRGKDALAVTKRDLLADRSASFERAILVWLKDQEVR